MSSTYLYDGTFSSLLALISILVDLKNNPDDIKSERKYEPNLLDTPVYLDLGNLEEKIKILKNKISVNVFHTVYYAYLSVNPKKELIIYYFIKNAIKYKDEVYFHRNLKCVNETLKISQNVSREAHHMKGFLRFKQMKNCYYAEINPTNDVIGIVADHFKKRLKEDCWVVKDVNRGKYAIYDLKDVMYIGEEDIKSINLNLAEKEEEFEKLWKTFFQTIAIKERKNLKVQMSFMPKKYWNYILEMEDEK